jgi:NAD(P)-dependent dehydrogenase (short-subunit alcohol dehydrogenase family)
MLEPDHQPVALVTGGSRGVGLGIVAAFLAAGHRVVTCGRREPTGPLLPGEKQPEWRQADVRDPTQVDALIQAVVDRHGRLDVLVNNAGGSPSAAAATASPRFHEAIIRLNLIAPLHCAQAANRVMQAQASGGCIVNVASVSALRPSPGTAAYGAAKAGLLNLTASLAVEWAPKVRVNAVTAGPILTEQAALHYGDAAGQAAVAATIPAGRLGLPSDVAQACLWLCSPAASWVSGASLLVHGGGEAPAFLAAAQKE